MPKDEPLVKRFTINNVKNVDYLNIFLLGSYSSEDKEKQFTIKDIYIYSLSSKETRFFAGIQKQRLFEKYKIK